MSTLDRYDSLVLEKLRSRGEAWIVGGWVRDSLSGLRPKELDIATTLEPDEVRSIFPRSIMVGERFGTVRVRLDEVSDKDAMWEVTTLRTDGGYGDGRRPDNVEFGKEIEEDLSRRDFTINAMAVDKMGLVIDPHGGMADLESGVVRSVGDPEKRISEDGLRTIRAFRFLEKGELGVRRLDRRLNEAISANLGMLDKVSRERIWSELKCILGGQNCGKIIEMMVENGIMEKILPDISVNLVVSLCQNHLVNLALICSKEEVGGSELVEKLDVLLRLSNDEASSIKFLHGCRGIELDHSDGSIRRFRAALPIFRQREVIDYCIGMGIEHKQFKRSLEITEDLKKGNSPMIDGNMLSEHTGLNPGKRLGRLKAWLHRIQIEKDMDDASELLTMADQLDWLESDPEEWPILSWP